MISRPSFPLWSLCTALLLACSSSDDNSGSPGDAGPDAGDAVEGDSSVDADTVDRPDLSGPDVIDVDEVSPDIEVDAEVDAEIIEDVEIDVPAAPIRAAGAITSGGGMSVSSRYRAIGATTGGLLRRSSSRFVSLGKVTLISPSGVQE
jgi:hypothetical protein